MVVFGTKPPGQFNPERRRGTHDSPSLKYSGRQNQSVCFVAPGSVVECGVHLPSPAVSPGLILKVLLGHEMHSGIALFSKPAAHMQSLQDAPPGRNVVVCFWHCSGFASPPRQTEPIAHTEHVNPLGRLSGNMLGGQRHSCKSADCDIFTKRFLTLASTHRTPLCAMVTITPTRTPIVRSDRQMRAACYEECSSCRQYPRDTLKAFQ